MKNLTSNIVMEIVNDPKIGSDPLTKSLALNSGMMPSIDTTLSIKDVAELRDVV